MEIHIRHPNSKQELAERDALLEQYIWKDLPSDSSICQEYPLVLGEENRSNSYCLFSHDRLVGHFNYFKRNLNNPSNTEIALIGNVVIHESMQKKGLMKRMLNSTLLADENQKTVTVLWSDEPAIYQSLGFKPFGQEYRYTFRKLKEPSPHLFHYEMASDLSDQDVATLLQLRGTQFWTPKRTIQEMKVLLTIPNCSLMLHRNGLGVITEFLVVGRGMDFIATIHEWGGCDPYILRQGVNQILELTQWEYVMMIAPKDLLDDVYWKFLFQDGELRKTHMALGRFPLGCDQEAMSQSFFWGLDSI